MCFLVFLAVITYCHVIGGTETPVRKLHHPQKRNIELTLEQRACIGTQFFQRNVNNPTCATVQAGIEMLYDVENVIEAIATRLDLLTHFVNLSVVKLSLIPGEYVKPTLILETKQSF